LPTATAFFRIRKPPIVLVHGIGSDNSTWYNSDGSPKAFLAALESGFPPDFIMPVDAGVDSTRNTSDRFDTLASGLDSELRAQVEDAVSPWHQGWAFTRYDVVGHSQGGLLARMLCTKYDHAPPFLAFRSVNNAFRGRFRRVITLNTPHNGTTLAHYVADLIAQAPAYLTSLVPEELSPLKLVEKFDPFPSDNQISDLAVNWPVDPSAKFNLVGTSIREGKPPRVFELLPKSYSVPGLSSLVIGHTYSAGKIVIPLGSDGIVDLGSQFAGLAPKAPITSITGTNIAHFNLSSDCPASFFQDSLSDSVCYVLNSQIVGSMVADLLNGPSSDFGNFVFTPVDPALASQIDAAVPPLRLLFDVIQFLPLAPEKESPSTTTYQLKLSPPPDSQPAGPPSWYGEVVGPDGVTTKGVTVSPDVGDPQMVTVSVDDSVAGDVVLHVSYNDTNASLVTGDPVVVVSRPPGETLTAIQLVPADISLTVGSAAATQVWGDYDNGTRSQLFIPSDAVITYTSENSAITTVDAGGKIQLVAVGTTNIDVSYLGFAAQTSVTSSAVPPPPVLAPLGAVSRKVHKTAGTFDINLALTGDEGIECRSGGRGGKYQMVVTFASPVTVTSASVTSGTGSVSGFTITGSQVTINLASVTTAQRMTVMLSGVSDGTSTNDVVIPMAILVGDVTAEGVVDNSDLTQARSAVGQPVTIVNFRDDVSPDGQINKKDSNSIRSNLGSQLPPL
jgi:pimeloyl-ACP methyl ester carboxylesterase